MTAGSAGLPAVFLDRDGVISRDVDYLLSVRQLRLLPRAAEAIRRLNEAGFRVVVVTNQSAIARGWLSLTDLDGIHAELRRRLDRRGARLDAIYVCPHHPAQGKGPFRRRCRCRKPSPGLLLRASRELGLSLSRSLLVGDQVSDLEAGKRAGCMTALVLSGQGRAAWKAARSGGCAEIADVVRSSFPRVVDWWLARRA